METPSARKIRSMGNAGAILVTVFAWTMLGMTALLGSAHAAQATNAATVLVLGDSISAGYGIQREQGWVHLLSVRLARTKPSYVVVNASVSGDTTGGGLARLPALLQRHRPKLVIVELGGNDGLRGYPVARMRANLENIVDRSLASGAKVVLVGMEIPPNYGPRYVDQFRAVFPQVAASRKAPLVPFLMRDVALNRQLMQADGIHPTAAGQPAMLATIWPEIARVLRVR